MITGYLRLIDQIPLTDKGQCYSNYTFITDSNVIYENLQNDVEAPINIRIGVEIESNQIVSWDYLDDTPIEYINKSIKDIALVRIVSPPGHNKEEEIDKVNRHAKDLEDFLKHVNDGHWEYISVTPYFIVNDEQQGMGLSSFNFEKVGDRIREQAPDDRDPFERHTYWHGWGGSHSEYLGVAYRNAGVAWTYASGQRTMRHEQGHCFGCPHSSDLDDEYGDPTCVMARARSGFNAWQTLRMDQIELEHFKEVSFGEKGIYYLCPNEVPSTDVRQNEYKAIAVREKEGSFGSLGISTRKSSKQSYTGTRRDDGMLHIHRISVTSGGDIRGGNTVYLKTLSEGDVFESEDVTIKHAGVKDSIVKVEINEPSLGEENYPKPLPKIAGDEFTKEQSILWHDPKYKYQGIDMFVLPEEKRIIGYWFTHLPRGETSSGLRKISSRVWYMIEGEIDEETNIVNCTIYQTYDRTLKVDGHGTFRLDDNVLLFRYHTESYGRDHMTFHPLTHPKEGDISGIYETGDHEGFSVGKYGKLYVAYNFTYGMLESRDLEWEIYLGEDISSVEGYRPDGRYKITYEKNLNKQKNLDLQSIIDSSKKIL